MTKRLYVYFANVVIRKDGQSKISTVLGTTVAESENVVDDIVQQKVIDQFENHGFEMLGKEIFPVPDNHIKELTRARLEEDNNYLELNEESNE